MNQTEIGFFCSPIGLGHATRDTAIAQILNKNIKFVTGIGAAKLIAEHGFSVIDAYNPPSFKVQNGELRKSLGWLWKYYQYYKDCKKISQKFLESEKLKLLVSDEDFASLAIAQQKKIPAILITDILETRFTKGIGSVIEKKMNKSMTSMIQKCNAVILPEIGQDHDNITYVGPIVRTTNYTREELRKKFAFERKTITVSTGGTDAGKFLVDKIIKTLPKIKSDYEVVLVSGPSLKIQTQNIRNLGFVNNLHEIIFASDLVISLAGKSTIDESKVYGTPGIFIPIKNHFEQEDNAKNEGYSFEDIFRLEPLITQKIEEERNPIGINGARKAAQIIQDQLSANP